MNKEKWGIKRICLSCGTRFYDLNKSPIICPSCGEVFDPEYLQKKKSKIVLDKDTSEDIVDVDLLDNIDNEDNDNLDDEDVTLNDQEN